MHEIRFHGRGGQGTVVATILLAKAFFNAGYQVQTFPLFGVERRGAPVEAYIRLDTQTILTRTNVYSPDHVAVQDFTLLHSIDVTKGLKSNGWVLINSPVPPEDLSAFTQFRLAFVDASKIALRHRLGTRTHPMVNTSMIGAFARILEMPPLEAIAAAIEEDLPNRYEENIKAAEDAYHEVSIVDMNSRTQE
jgi:2-oxoacid:acceptor oxidoreductase gamma subunit (pyruvate/2-ketoisovalerate family)